MRKKVLFLAGGVVLAVSGCAHDRKHDQHGGHGMRPQLCTGAACNIKVTVVTGTNGRCIAFVDPADSTIIVKEAKNIHWNLRTQGYSFPADPAPIFFKTPNTEFVPVSGGTTQYILHDRHSLSLPPGSKVPYSYGIRVKDDKANAMCDELDPVIVNEY